MRVKPCALPFATAFASKFFRLTKWATKTGQNEGEAGGGGGRLVNVCIYTHDIIIYVYIYIYMYYYMWESLVQVVCVRISHKPGGLVLFASVQQR